MRPGNEVENEVDKFFISVLGGSQPNCARKAIERFMSLIAHIQDNSTQLYFVIFEVVLIVFRQTHPILHSSNRSMGEQ
jgi:hypothetical protein